MSEDYLFSVSDDIAKTAWIDKDKYLKWYESSLEDPEVFWKEHGKRIDWIKPYTKIKDVDFSQSALTSNFIDRYQRLMGATWANKYAARQNRNAYDIAKKRAEDALRQRDEIRNATREINIIKCEMHEIKSMLKTFMENN